MSRPLPGYGRPLRLWEVLSVHPTITYDELMRLDLKSELVKLPEFEEEFDLSDNELAERLSYLDDLGEITRLAALYMLHVKETKDEFTEYLNSQSLELAVNVSHALSCADTMRMRLYFVQRMPTDNVIDYIIELRELGLIGSPMNQVFIAAMRMYTKNYDVDVVNKLIILMEDYKHADWARAVIPYAPDSLLDRLWDVLDSNDTLDHIYRAALENSEQRLSYIIDYISKFVNYERQLATYVDDIEYVMRFPPSYGTIVMTLVKKMGKDLPSLDLMETSFNTWKTNMLNGQV